MIEFKLEKPDLSKVDTYQVIMKAGQTDDLTKFTPRASYPKYLYWDKVKYLDRPEGWTAEILWAHIKFLRRTSSNRSDSVVKSENGKIFTWGRLVQFEYLCHQIDMDLGGNLTTPFAGILAGPKKLMSNSIMEEAIASSQMEGANTTRKVAKGMLQKKLKPKDRSMQMIANNYKAMLALESDFKDSKLDLSMLFNLHEILTKNTLENKNEVGRLRTDSDDIVVTNKEGTLIYHTPPKEAFLQTEITRLIDYANDDLNDGMFVHPIIKAIIVHFWIGYIHPFTDGNGRMARALFYWYLLRHNYRIFSYLPLSILIKDSYAQYRDAYSYSEQDDNDLTYFIDYNMRTIMQAKNNFGKYLKRKQAESRELNEIARSKYDLNERQIQLLRYLHKNRGENTTYNTHSNIYRVTRLTARKDLLKLEKIGLLSSKRIGRQIHFYGTGMITGLFGN